MDDSSQEFYLRLRGLPWSSSAEDIRMFLQNVNVCDDEYAIIFVVTAEGKRTGDALVKIASHEDLEKALTYHKKYMGKRYIEVLKSSRSEFDTHAEKAVVGEGELIVRLRGLPYSATEADLREFFQGLEIVPQGILLLRDQEGRCSGDAYVEFFSPNDVLQALQKHRQKIGTRFIEVYRSTKAEMVYMGSKPVEVRSHRQERGGGAYGRDCHPEYSPKNSYLVEEREPHGGYADDQQSGSDSPPSERYIHMRGLPFDCYEEDVEDFFYPLDLSSIGFCYGQDDRFNGECDVFFMNESDCMQALKRDKRRIGKRYAELFLRKRRMFRSRRRRYHSRESLEGAHAVPKPMRDYRDNYAPSPFSPFTAGYMPASPVPPKHQAPYAASSYDSNPAGRAKSMAYSDSAPAQTFFNTQQHSYRDTGEYYPESGMIPTKISPDSDSLNGRSSQKYY